MAARARPRGSRLTAAALYVRTSTADQDGRAQLHQLRKAAAARQLRRPAEFVDVGHSGAKASRPALDRLRAAARAGDVGVVLVAALDRLGRNLPELLLLVDELAAGGCLVVSLREQLDLTTPAGRLMLQLFGALAQFEREIIRERVKTGIARAKEKGTRSGKPIGRPARAVDLVQLDRLRREGKSWRAIAQILRVPRRTLERAHVAGVETSAAWVNWSAHKPPPKKRPTRRRGT